MPARARPAAPPPRPGGARRPRIGASLPPTNTAPLSAPAVARLPGGGHPPRRGARRPRPPPTSLHPAPRAGAYHGHLDGLLAQAGSGLATAGIPASPGVPESATHETVIVPFNDGEAVAKAFAEHEFAAVIAEPYPANMGLVPPVEGFLELL